MVKLVPTETDCGHEVDLAGAWHPLASGMPTLIARTDEDFIDALLAELAGENPASIATDCRPTAGTDGMLRLYQPVHRTFNLALVEAHCVNFGLPRLDPKKIDSAGLVVRRVGTNRNGSKVYEAWCSNKSKVAGWTPLPDDEVEHLRDPDPTRRPQARLTADAEFDRKKFGTGDITAEEHTSLFVAPADVTAATKRTLLYGVVPVTSSSRAGSLPRGVEDDAWKNAWPEHISLLIRASSSPTGLWPSMNKDDGGAALSLDDIKGNSVTLPDDTKNPYIVRFTLLVRQLAQEFSLLRPKNPKTSQELISKLNQMDVVLVDGSTTPAGDYLQLAGRFYFDPVPKAADRTTPESPHYLRVLRPKTWPAISAALANDIMNLLRQISGEIELSTLAPAGTAGRYDDHAARYVVRTFIRVKQPCNCPPKIVWSLYSEEFRIVPWYEAGPLAPIPVVLPDPFDPNFLKSARPNVAFTVPKKLAGFLNQDPKKLIKGEGGEGPSMSLDWICGFSIPIITICAFILLNIVLNLLNLIFRWLPFVKICIPFPRPSQPPPSPSSP